MINDKSYDGLNVSSVGAIAKIDAMLRSEIDFKSLSIPEVSQAFENEPEIANIIIGLWAFDLLKKPEFNKGRLKSYDGFLNEGDVLKISNGLISIIKHCNIDMDEDIHAIDYHYSACLKLYHLMGNQAEELILDCLQTHQSIPLIEALGVLVGHEIQGYLSEKSIILLKNISNEKFNKFAYHAKRILVEDVERVMGPLDKL